MLISFEDSTDFLRIYTALMHYAGRERGVIPVDISFDDFMDTSLSTIRLILLDEITDLR